MSVEMKLRELGLELPDPPAPVASYVPSLQSGQFVFTSGQIPFIDGALEYRGVVGDDLDLEEGREAAQICLLNALAVLKKELGSLDRIDRVVQLVGYVRCTGDFEDQPKVLNGASDLLIELFEDRGKHTRMALGTNALPLGASVELALMVSVHP